MSERKIPQRKDLVSGQLFDKNQLLRIVINKENKILIDENGKLDGRGAYILIDKQSAVTVKNKKMLDRTFKTKVDEEIYNQLIESIDHLVSRKELLAD